MPTLINRFIPGTTPEEVIDTMHKRGPKLTPTSEPQQSQRGSFGFHEPVPQPAEDVSPAPEDTSGGGIELGPVQTEFPGRKLGE